MTNELTQQLDALQRAYRAHPCPSAGERREHLQRLKTQISRYQDLFADAAHADFGTRPQFESRLVEVIGTLWVLDHARRNVTKWMRPKSRMPELMFAGPNTLKVTYQPKGVVGIVTPWNMPLYLSLGPLAAALAAGNRAMIKLPEVTPHCNAVIKRMLAEIFPDDHVAVVGEELANPAGFTELPFNHLIFTGSPRIGRIVAQAAAKNLVPVTLELGGKSPAIVCDDYPIDDAARRIVHGKVTMCGQICVAPDYALVPTHALPGFVAAVQKAFVQMAPDGASGRPEYSALIDDRQLARIKQLLADAQAKGAQVTALAAWDGGRQMPLHVVANISDDMEIAHEEVFGPLLPVKTYGTFDEALNYVNDHPRPLALYCFTTDKRRRDAVLQRTHSGGVTINDWGWHTVNAAVPFGGTGNSGMGTYHGEEGFRELSHAKSVFQRARIFPTQLFHPPVNIGWRGGFQRMWMNFYAGKADSSLDGTPYGEAFAKKAGRP